MSIEFGPIPMWDGFLPQSAWHRPILVWAIWGASPRRGGMVRKTSFPPPHYVPTIREITSHRRCNKWPRPVMHERQPAEGVAGEARGGAMSTGSCRTHRHTSWWSARPSLEARCRRSKSWCMARFAMSPSDHCGYERHMLATEFGSFNNILASNCRGSSRHRKLAGWSCVGIAAEAWLRRVTSILHTNHQCRRNRPPTC